jgi:hypothetical protein
MESFQLDRVITSAVPKASRVWFHLLPDFHRWLLVHRSHHTDSFGIIECAVPTWRSHGEVAETDRLGIVIARSAAYLRFALVVPTSAAKGPGDPLPSVVFWNDACGDLRTFMREEACHLRAP